MFWADKVAQELKIRNLPLEWVDDMKTPSGRIHVGSLRGIVAHGLIYKALLDVGVKATFTYVFEDHDPMDALPVYLKKEIYEQYLGMPLFAIPSPEPKKADNFAKFYAQEFVEVFTTIGCNPEILWVSDLYKSGRMNDMVRLCLDKADVIRNIYEELYKKSMPKEWYPFHVYCPRCKKVSTTRVTGWDGKEVTFTCEREKVSWTKGCGESGKISPLSDENNIRGKLPWKVEWACKWKAIGVTVEGAGKDHMTKGGSHDLTSLVAKRVLDYAVPYSFSYEFFLIGGKKMSSSKGRGFPAPQVLEILPPELVRFLMVRARISEQINFDPTEPTTIPRLFDEYDRYQTAYLDKSDPDMARVFELSQVGEVNTKKYMQFGDVVNLLQMPGKERELEREDVRPRVGYARIWLERFAPEEKRFTVKEEFPEAALHLSAIQKMYLEKVSEDLIKKWEPEEFQQRLYAVAKELGLSSKDAFAAIYLCLLGKDHGPKAAWLILSLDEKFVQDRFCEAASTFQ